MPRLGGYVAQEAGPSQRLSSGKIEEQQHSHILQRLKSLSVGSPIPKIWGKIGIGTLGKFKGSAGRESGRASCMETRGST